MSGPAPLAPLTADQRDGLRATLLRARDEYRFYREVFARAGVTAEAVGADPQAALARLPVFDPAQVNRLASEALRLRAHDLGGVELTTGTSGTPKRRVLSEADVRLDAALIAGLMRLAGVRADDRVAAVDLTADPLSLAFLEGCERLGVRAATAVAAAGELDAAPLRRLAPTVLIGPPALLTRLLPALIGGDAPATPRLVIYNGDRLPAPATATLRACRVGVRSLYGLTETSALGVECPAERGVHLATTGALAEVRGHGRGRELVVTTLGYSMPLLRYPTGDRVRPPRGRCACGSPWPRVMVEGRLDARFAVFDVKFTPDDFERLLLEEPGDVLQIVLTSRPGGRERITFRLPAARRPHRRELRDRLHAHPLLAALLASRLVETRLRFVEPAPAGRKVPAVVDRRGRG